MAIGVLDILPVTTAAILSTQILQFDVRSTVAFRRVVVSLDFVGFQFREVAYEGDPVVDGAAGFEELYSGRSTIASIVDAGYTRFRFRIARSPAWPASPTMIVVAYNTSGEEV